MCGRGTVGCLSINAYDLTNVLTTSRLVLHEGKLGYEQYFYGRHSMGLKLHWLNSLFEMQGVPLEYLAREHMKLI